MYNSLIPDLGDICEVDNDCTKRIKNVKCTGMTCVCIDSYYELNKQRVPGNFDFHCCTFKRYHFLSKHTKKSDFIKIIFLPGLNSSCISNASCVPKDSICKSNDCICKERYIAELVNTCV